MITSLEQNKTNIDYDILLEYLSRKKCGTWLQFKRAIKGLYLNENKYDEEYDEKDLIDNKGERKQTRSFLTPLYTLSRLGHLDFIFSGKDSYFTISPSVISMLPNSYKGVLCGYRTTELLQKLEKNCEELDIDFIKEDNPNAPSAIFIDFKNQENINIFQEFFDFKIVQNVSTTILKNVPSVDNFINSITNGITKPVEDISKFDGKVFSRRFLCEWFNSNEKNINDWDLYQENIKYDSNKFYIFYNDKYYPIDLNYGYFINICESHRSIQKILTYNKESKQLKIKKNLNFPILIDRALALHSGKNIYVNNIGMKIYDNISEDIINLLNKKLKFTDEEWK